MNGKRVNSKFPPFFNDPRIRVINCSWGSPFYPIDEYLPFVGVKPDKNPERSGFNMWKMWRDSYWYAPARFYNTLKPIFNEFASGERLFTWAVGNEGRSMGIESLMSHYDPTVQNLVNVIALDSNGIVMQDGDIVELKPNGVTPFTSHAWQSGMLTAVSAPGVHINSANADGGYVKYSGTSMAAPVVAGIGALVAEAHPWMKGKHLADSILTTADSSFDFPDEILHVRGEQRRVDGESKLTWHFVLYRTANETAPEAFKIVDRTKVPDREVLRSHLKALAKAEFTERYDRGYYHYVCTLIDKWLDLDEKDPDRPIFYLKEGMNREEFFGQGIVDAEKAVKGIARLDANRLLAKNRVMIEGEAPFAADVFDTAGFSSVFANDIDERRWEDRYHYYQYRTDYIPKSGEEGINADALALNNLPVGFEKRGEGTLTLTGHNTYFGGTVISGGAISVTRVEGKADSGQLVNSNVWINACGTLKGNGTVMQKVTNHGRVAPGNSIGTLTVGTYRQASDGQLAIEFNTAGRQDFLHVTREGSLAGNLVFMPVPEYVKNGTAVSLMNPVTGVNITGHFDNTLADSRSPTLNLSVTSTPSGYLLTTDRNRDAYARYAPNKGAAELGFMLHGITARADNPMKDLMTALDFSDIEGRTVGDALRQLSPEIHDVAVSAETDGFETLTRDTLHSVLRQTEGEARDGVSVRLLGQMTHRNDHAGFTGWRTKTSGIDAQKRVKFHETINASFSLTALERHSEMSDGLAGKANASGVYAGAVFNWQPSILAGASLLSEVRLGVTDNRVKRSPVVAGRIQSLEADWTGYAGRFLLGLSRDWQAHGWTFGPIAWTAIDFVHRPDVTEKGGSWALKTASQTYDSLSTQVGLHAGAAAKNGDHEFFADFLITRRDRWTCETVHQDAAFLAAPNDGWRSATEVAARDGFILDGSIGIGSGAFNLMLNASAECLESGQNDARVQLGLGWQF